MNLILIWKDFGQNYEYMNINTKINVLVTALPPVPLYRRMGKWSKLSEMNITHEELKITSEINVISFNWSKPCYVSFLILPRVRVHGRTNEKVMHQRLLTFLVDPSNVILIFKILSALRTY